MAAERRRLHDFRYINREIPIIEIAQALDLRIGSNGNAHCWHPEQHQNGDRTASVGINKTTNTVKCFGCGIGPLSPIDLVCAVHGFDNPREAAEWVAARFPVPELAPRTHLVTPERPVFQFGQETELGVLIYSGLWARLSPSARAIAPVLFEFARSKGYASVTISYIAITRYSGVVSPNAISKAIRELEEFHWLKIQPGARTAEAAPVRGVSTYVLTARSDELYELAQSTFANTKKEIDDQRNLRSELRARRKAARLQGTDSLSQE